MLQLVVWPLISVRYTVTTSPLARGSIRTVRDLGRMSPAKVDRAAFSFQVPKAVQNRSLPGARLSGRAVAANALIIR